MSLQKEFKSNNPESYPSVKAAEEKLAAKTSAVKRSEQVSKNIDS